MKDVRPKVKKLLTNLPVPDWDPWRTFVNFPRGEAPDIPFCHYEPLLTLFFEGAKFEVLQYVSRFSQGAEDPILRITIDGIMYHVAICPQFDDELLYSVYFCKCEDLPVQVELHYMERKPKGLFDVSIYGNIEIHYEYRRDHQKHLDTTDSDVKEFFQYMINLCRRFYLAHKQDLKNI